MACASGLRRWRARSSGGPRCARSVGDRRAPASARPTRPSHALRQRMSSSSAAAAAAGDSSVSRQPTALGLIGSMPRRNLVSGLAQHSRHHHELAAFDCMRRAGLAPTQFALSRKKKRVLTHTTLGVVMEKRSLNPGSLPNWYLHMTVVRAYFSSLPCFGVIFDFPHLDERLQFSSEMPYHQELIPPNGELTLGEYSQRRLHKFYSGR